MQEARKQPWFENTIFVLLGDHGKLVGSPDCEIPQSYNHVPLMIYGKGIKPEIRQEPGGQTDVAPTLLGLLNMSYTQNDFGINLLTEQRPYVYFSADNLIAATDTPHSAMWRNSIFSSRRMYCPPLLQVARHFLASYI